MGLKLYTARTYNPPPFFRLVFWGLFGVYLGFNSVNKPQSRLKPTKHITSKNRIRKPFIKDYKIPLKVKKPFGKDEVTGSNPVISSINPDNHLIVRIYGADNGIRKGVKKTVLRTVFSPSS